MVNSTNKQGGQKRGGSKRQQKAPKTIDLEAVAVDETKATKSDADGQKPVSKGPEPNKNKSQSTSEKKSTPNSGSSSIGQLLISAVVGGGIALGGSTLLGQSGLIGNSSDTEGSSQTIALQDIQTQITGLQEKLAQLNSQTTNGSQTDPAITSQIETLKNSIDEINASASSQNSSSENLSSEIALLREEFGTVQTNSEEAVQRAGDASNQISELNQKILENAGSGSVDTETVKAAFAGEISELAKRINALESNNSEDTTQAFTNRLNEIDQKISSFDQNDSETRFAEITPKLSDLEEQLSGLSSTVDGVSSRLGDIETNIGTQILPMIHKMEQASGAAIEGQRLARSMSARAIGVALDQGGNLSRELVTVEALIGESASLSRLKGLAKTGIETHGQLLESFNEVSNSILALDAKPADEEGVMSRLMSSAKSLIKVRPSGPVDGEGTEAVLSRIKAALETKSLSKANEEWQTLTAQAKELSSDWSDNLNNRIEAQALSNDLILQLGSADTQAEEG